MVWVVSLRASGKSWKGTKVGDIRQSSPSLSLCIETYILLNWTELERHLSSFWNWQKTCQPLHFYHTNTNHVVQISCLQFRSFPVKQKCQVSFWWHVLLHRWSWRVRRSTIIKGSRLKHFSVWGRHRSWSWTQRMNKHLWAAFEGIIVVTAPLQSVSLWSHVTGEDNKLCIIWLVQPKLWKSWNIF